MKKLHLLKKTAALLCVGVLTVMPVSANDIHVATNGDNNNAGTVEAPLLTIDKAMEIVQPGDRILVHEGTYMITKRIKIPALNTNPDLRCELRAWPEDAVGKVIIDGTNMNPSSEIEFKQSRCIYVNHEANYWTFYGLVLQNAKDNGMKIEGSYNIVERCTFRWNNDTGLQIGMFKDFSIEETKSFPISGKPAFNPNFSYCRYNKVINCDSYENADLKSYSGSDDGGDADGFAVKLFPGPGTEFHGCRAWTNSDDNWDLYMTYHPVVIDHCWAWHAGYLPNGGEGKNGNGFKLGGGGSAGGANFDHSVGAHVLTNCVAFENLHKGFDQNNAYEGMYIFNCVAWGNEYNYRFPTEFKYISSTVWPGAMSTTTASPQSSNMAQWISTTVLVGTQRQRRVVGRLVTTSSCRQIKTAIKTLLKAQPTIPGLKSTAVVPSRKASSPMVVLILLRHKTTAASSCHCLSLTSWPTVKQTVRCPTTTLPA